MYKLINFSTPKLIYTYRPMTSCTVQTYQLGSAQSMSSVSTAAGRLTAGACLLTMAVQYTHTASCSADSQA